MMRETLLFDNGHYQWHMLGRDDSKPELIIDTNQYIVTTPNRTLLIDPGGIELFSQMLASVLRYADIEHITDIFASHQDPDIISSLGLWDQALPEARLHAPWLWEGFLRHFGCNRIQYVPIADDGGSIELGEVSLKLIPAHYLHSSGNFNVYDRNAKILMSGDIGAALEPPSGPMFVEDFDEHVPHMKMFHQRWMPSEPAKQDWIRRVRELDIDMMAPQHGRVFRGDDVKRFLDWFEALEVGVAIDSSGAAPRFAEAS